MENFTAALKNYTVINSVRQNCIGWLITNIITVKVQNCIQCILFIL